MGFSRQEYWSGLPFPSPGDLPDPGIEPRSPTLQADALTSAPPGNLFTLFHTKKLRNCFQYMEVNLFFNTSNWSNIHLFQVLKKKSSVFILYIKSFLTKNGKQIRLMKTNSLGIDEKY